MMVLLAGAYLGDPRQGSPRVLLRLHDELRSMGHEVECLFLDALPGWARGHRLSWILFPVVVFLRVLRAQTRGEPYAVVEVSGGDGWLLVALRGAFRLHCTLICRSHGWEHEDYRTSLSTAGTRPKWARALLFRILRLPMVASWAKHADAILVGSAPVRDYAVRRRWKPPERVFVVPCGVDQRFLAPDGSKRGRGLLFVGSWIERKGVSNLAEAYDLMCSRGAQIPLSIVGFGCAPQDVLQCFRPALRSAIRVDDTLRMVDDATLVREYQTHDILVFPSWYEGFGMVFLEAMAAGLPVVATPVGGVVDVVRDGENGVVVPVGNPDALATAILELWRSPDRRAQLGAAAQQTARRYGWRDVGRQTVRCYEAAMRLVQA